jgi:branched-subunit amino acid aminotransferase/4-amino-4-deoxychorismate lyase
MNSPGCLKDVCLLDGELVPDALITVSARGGLVSHGEGLFETLPVLGGSARFLEAHLRRLSASCRALGFGPGPDDAVIRDDLAKLAKALGTRDFSLRIVVYAEGGRIHRLLVPSPLPDDVDRPVALGIVPEPFNGPRSLATLKTLNYLVPRLAHAEGMKRGFDEVLFTLADGTVLEGTRSSVFMVSAGAIVTPPLSLPILPGVTREVILGCARLAGIPVAEREFTIAEMHAAGEAFISASVRGVRAVRSLEGRPLAGCPGALTERVRALYRERILAPD